MNTIYGNQYIPLPIPDIGTIVLIFVSWWSISFFFDLLWLDIQVRTARSREKERLRQEALESKVTQASPNPDGGKDNRPWYKKKRYIIPLVIVVIGIGVGAWYYFSSGGDISGPAAAGASLVTVEQLENLIEIKNAKKNAINLIGICHGNLANTNIHDFDQLVSETLVNVIQHKPDYVPAVQDAIAHAHTILTTTKSMESVGISRRAAHIATQAAIVFATDGGVQELIKTTDVSLVVAQNALAQELALLSGIEHITSTGAKTVHELLPYTQVIGEQLATTHIEMMTKLVEQAKVTGDCISPIEISKIAVTIENSATIVDLIGVVGPGGDISYVKT